MKTMPMNRRGVLCTMLLALACAGGVQAQEAIDNTSPQKLVETAAKALLADLDANRATYRRDPAALSQAIDSKFLPHVDVPYAAQQVLGANWRNATPDQRQRFIAAFKNVMLKTYGSALIEFTGDNFRLKPFRGDPAAASASVDAEIKQANGSVVPVSFVLRKTGTAWKVWDVKIEGGLRVVGIFRDDFGPVVQQRGLDALIASLEAGRAPPEAARGSSQ